jgi:hypothetical protein
MLTYILLSHRYDLLCRNVSISQTTRFDMDHVCGGTQPQEVASLVSIYALLVFIRLLTGTATNPSPQRLEPLLHKQQSELLTDHHL